MPPVERPETSATEVAQHCKIRANGADFACRG